MPRARPLIVFFFQSVVFEHSLPYGKGHAPCVAFFDYLSVGTVWVAGLRVAADAGSRA